MLRRCTFERYQAVTEHILAHYNVCMFCMQGRLLVE